jgi:(p)ppGpp synthase/HD superfamily hydrolase
MNEDAIKEKIEVYQAAFKNLYEQAIQDIEKLTGHGAQASQASINEFTEKVRETLFGYRRGKDFKVEKG